MDTTGKLGRGDKRLLSYSVRLLKTTFRRWLEDKASQLGAALAYYTVFSLAPMAKKPKKGPMKTFVSPGAKQCSLSRLMDPIL